MGSCYPILNAAARLGWGTPSLCQVETGKATAGPRSTPIDGTIFAQGRLSAPLIPPSRCEGGGPEKRFAQDDTVQMCGPRFARPIVFGMTRRKAKAGPSAPLKNASLGMTPGKNEFVLSHPKRRPRV
jgi:hypothetical protein